MALLDARYPIENVKERRDDIKEKRTRYRKINGVPVKERKIRGNFHEQQL